MRSQYVNLAVVVIGPRLFDLTNGWDGKPAAGEHVFVVTHNPPASWEHANTAPFTFVDGVEAAIRAAQEYAGDRIVDGAAGEIGGQALRLASSIRWSSILFPSCSAPAVPSSRLARWPIRYFSAILLGSFRATA